MEEKMNITNETFSEVDYLIFDCMLNIRRPYDHRSILETLSVVFQKSREDLEGRWNELVEVGYIKKQDYYWTINTSLEPKIRESTEKFLERRGITLESCIAEIDKEAEEQAKLVLLIKLAGQITEREGKKYLLFVDYDWESDVGRFCEELMKKRVMFRQSTSSRKHSYRTYYLRTWPFDAKDIIISIVNKRVNVEGLSKEEWNLLSLLLLSPNLKLKYETIRSNLHDLTESELREVITRLKRRGVIDERYQEASLLKGLKEPFFQYFTTNVYPQTKQDVVNDLKRRISRSIANLWIFTGIKRLSELPMGEEKAQPVPIKLIKKDQIEDLQLLSDAKRLKLAAELDDEVLIHVDILKEIENWLKSSIKETLIYIPAGDLFLASNILREIFSKCEEYVKIQDPYIDEETFHILQYIPSEIRIELLTGIKTGWRGEDLDLAQRICKWIERFKAERRGKFEVVFIGRSDTGEPPFHDRFITSKNRCWQVGTSLKQIGRGKDTVINELSKREKEEIIEPAFERWWNASPKELKRRNLTKLSFQEWKENLLRSSE